MKQANIKRTPIFIAAIIFSIISIIFAILSLVYIENWIFRILLQVNVGLSTLLNGIHNIKNKGKRFDGYLLVGVSVFIFLVMTFTIVVTYIRE